MRPDAEGGEARLSAGVPLVASDVGTLVAALGGTVGARDATKRVERVRPVGAAGEGDLAPLTHGRYAKAAEEALARGAVLLVASAVAERLKAREGVWLHDHAAWALARILDERAVSEAWPAVVGAGTVLEPGVHLGPRVVVGRRVRIEPGAVIGRAGFGWAHAPDGRVVAVPQLGGVIVEDDVYIGPLCTIDAGTLGPTRIGRGVKLDAQVHVGHNVTLGEGTIVAAQAGFAGSVTVGRGVLVGGQAGLADHVVVGDGARIAAKAGVIGDVPAGATVAGYPAVERGVWLRAWARQLRGLGRGRRRNEP